MLSWCASSFMHAAVFVEPLGKNRLSLAFCEQECIYESNLRSPTRYRIVCQARPELHGWMDGYILITDLKKATSSFTWRCFLLKGRSWRDIYIYIYIFGKETSFQKTHVNSIHHFGPSITASKACTRCHQYEPDAIATLTGQGNVFLPGKLTLGIYLKSTYTLEIRKINLNQTFMTLCSSC